MRQKLYIFAEKMCSFEFFIDNCKNIYLNLYKNHILKDIIKKEYQNF